MLFLEWSIIILLESQMLATTGNFIIKRPTYGSWIWLRYQFHTSVGFNTSRKVSSFSIELVSACIVYDTWWRLKTSDWRAWESWKRFMLWATLKMTLQRHWMRPLILSATKVFGNHLCRSKASSWTGLRLNPTKKSQIRASPELSMNIKTHIWE